MVASWQAHGSARAQLRIVQPARVTTPTRDASDVTRGGNEARERERARAFVCSRTSVFSICSNDFAVCYCCCCRCCCVLTGYDATVSVHQWPHTGLAQASLEMVVNFSALSISRPRCVFKSLSIGCRRGPGVLPSKQSYLCPLSPFTGFHARACF